MKVKPTGSNSLPKTSSPEGKKQSPSTSPSGAADQIPLSDPFLVKLKASYTRADLKDGHRREKLLQLVTHRLLGEQWEKLPGVTPREKERLQAFLQRDPLLQEKILQLLSNLLDEP